MKYNREEIVKALEICSDETKEFCTGCPFIGNGGCKQSSILKLALSVIKELTEENEFHRKTISKNAQMALNVTVDEIEKTKADIVRKMQEKILAKSEYGTINMSHWQLDQIAKEMLEENK